MMGILPFANDIVRSSSRYEFGKSVLVPVARPEDLIILKLIAGRQKDTLDIVELYRIWPEVDTKRIRRIITEFAEALDDPSYIERMDDLLKP